VLAGEDLLFDEVPMAADDVRAEVYGPPQGVSRREEFVAFVALAVLIWPVLAIAIVGGYGFLIWMYQLVFGPPGPPH
jgi:nitrate reductase NapE